MEMQIIRMLVCVIIAAIAGSRLPTIVDSVLKRKYESRTKAWDAQHALYVSWKASHDGEPRKSHSRKVSNEENLCAVWAASQRFSYLHATLSREHYVQLKNEGFNFKNNTALKPEKAFKPSSVEREKYSYPCSAKSMILPVLSCIIASLCISLSAVEASNIAMKYNALFAGFGINAEIFAWIFTIFGTMFSIVTVFESMTDIRCMIIPWESNIKILLPLSIIFALTMYGIYGLINGLIAIVIYFVFFILLDKLISKFSHRPSSLGGGDKWMLLPVFIFVGSANFLMVIYVVLGWCLPAFVFACVGGIMQALRGDTGTLNNVLTASKAAGPFIAFGFVCSLVLLALFPNIVPFFIPSI